MDPPQSSRPLTFDDLDKTKPSFFGGGFSTDCQVVDFVPRSTSQSVFHSGNGQGNFGNINTTSPSDFHLGDNQESFGNIDSMSMQYPVDADGSDYFSLNAGHEWPSTPPAFNLSSRDDNLFGSVNAMNMRNFSDAVDNYNTSHNMLGDMESMSSPAFNDSSDDRSFGEGDVTTMDAFYQSARDLGLPFSSSDALHFGTFDNAFGQANGATMSQTPEPARDTPTDQQLSPSAYESLHFGTYSDEFGQVNGMTMDYSPESVRDTLTEQQMSPSSYEAPPSIVDQYDLRSLSEIDMALKMRNIETVLREGRVHPGINYMDNPNARVSPTLQAQNKLPPRGPKPRKTTTSRKSSGTDDINTSMVPSPQTQKTAPRKKAASLVSQKPSKPPKTQTPNSSAPQKRAAIEGPESYSSQPAKRPRSTFHSLSSSSRMSLPRTPEQNFGSSPVQRPRGTSQTPNAPPIPPRIDVFADFPNEQRHLLQMVQAFNESPGIQQEFQEQYGSSPAQRERLHRFIRSPYDQQRMIQHTLSNPEFQKLFAQRLQSVAAQQISPPQQPSTASRPLHVIQDLPFSSLSKAEKAALVAANLEMDAPTDTPTESYGAQRQRDAIDRASRAALEGKRR